MKNPNIVLDGNWTQLDTDVLILGSGLAGLLLSILLHERGATVTLASKETFSDSNTFYAQGGLAAVTSNGLLDSPAEHLNDTIKSGAGLTDLSVANQIITTAPHLVQTLVQLGTKFDKNGSGAFALAREGGHSKARVLHSKDTTGRTISNALLQTATAKASEATEFNLIDYCFACNLLTDGQKITGAEVLQNGVIKKSTLSMWYLPQVVPGRFSRAQPIRSLPPQMVWRWPTELVPLWQIWNSFSSIQPRFQCLVHRRS